MVPACAVAQRLNVVLVFISILAAFTLSATVLSEGFGIGLVSTSYIKVLGKTLCLCLVAIAMDLVWGYCGILSLGHFAFFGIGGYMIGMWLMYARTQDIVLASLANQALPATPQEIRDAIGTPCCTISSSTSGCTAPSTQPS